MLADAGYRVIVPHLRGYGTTTLPVGRRASATASSRCSRSTRSR